VHRIAINTAISYQRYSRMREVGQVIRRLGRPAPPADPGSVAERSDLFDALRKLPPKQAAAIVLRHHHGYTNREIAAALEIPERTVASRLIVAKARLRKLLDAEPRKEPGIDMSTFPEDSVPSD
jgi:RNA polymerase sigma factor (sigma-70 family)